MKKALITGGAGFVGYHLSLLLANNGIHVVIADNFSRARNDDDFENLLKKQNIELIKGDLTDPSAWEKLPIDCDFIYHLASVNGTKLFYEKPHEVLRIGLKTTLNLLDWYIKTGQSGKILYTSSNEAYASALDAFGSLPLPTPESVPLVISDPYNPRWSYGAQKLIGEMLFIHYANAHRFRMSIVRPHNFYGPRAGYDHVIPEFIERIGKMTDPFPIYGANTTRTFCYIDDAVEAIKLVMESDLTNLKTYHIGRSIEDEISMEKLAAVLFEIANWKPNNIEIKSAPDGSVLRRAPEVTKIKEEIGWTAKTDIKTGLKKTYEWYLKNPKS